MNETLSGQANVSYPVITILFHLDRLPTYFVVNIVIPSVLISILSTFVFLLPVESGEKISLQVDKPYNNLFIRIELLFLKISQLTLMTFSENFFQLED